MGLAHPCQQESNQARLVSAAEAGAERVWAVIPVFNNGTTVRDIALRCLAVLPNVIVVDDGSTDVDLQALLSDTGVVLLRHARNMGKGRAILTAAEYILSCGGAWMITIDGDGQHYPEDIRQFFPMIKEDKPAIIIGSRNFDTEHVPEKSRFGRKFAGFWLFVEAGKKVDDCQSGFRAYPLRYLSQLKCRGVHYDFEAEILARAAWAGLGIVTVPIKVHYPRPEERVSSFKPFLDNLRLTHSHAMLVWRRLLPLPHRKLVRTEGDGFSLLRHPGKFIRKLLRENATPGGLAAAAAGGVFFGALPLVFAHTFVILYVSSRLRLNKIVAVNAQHVCMPPFIPAICIEVGYFMRQGRWLSDISFATVFNQFSDRLLEWFLGSLIVAPIASVVVGGTVYGIASFVRRFRKMGETAE